MHFKAKESSGAFGAVRVVDVDFGGNVEETFWLLLVLSQTAHASSQKSLLGALDAGESLPSVPVALAIVVNSILPDGVDTQVCGFRKRQMLFNLT